MKHRFYHSLYKSFFSKEFYVDVLGEWRGTGMLYLLFLTTVVTVPFVYLMQKGYDEFVRTDAELILAQIQPMEIEDGKLSTPGNKPFMIKDPETGEVVAIVDPTGQYFEEGKEAPVYVQESQIVVQKSENERRTYEFRSVGNMQIDQEMVRGVLAVIGEWLPFVLFIPVLLCLYIWHILQALLYSVVTLLMTKILRVFLGYHECLRLVCVAMTPVILLKTVSRLGDFTLPSLGGGLWVLITLGYVYFGLKSFHEEVAND